MSSEELIREASDPATAPARLAELASADRATWPALAGNPSTYDGLLTWLGERDVPAVNAALAARAQAALPPVPPPAPAVAPVVETPAVAADEAPTVVSPVAPLTEPTAVFQAPSTEPTAVFQAPAAAEPTATYAAVPTANQTPAAPSDGDNSGKNLAIVVGMVAVVLALIAGAAWGATEVFGDDDEINVSAPAEPKKTTEPPANDEDEGIPSIAPPTIDSDDEDLPEASDDFCSTMTSVQKASEDLVDRTGSSPDLDDLKDMGEDMTEAYEDLAAAAPPELRSDIEAMGGYFELMTNPTADSATTMSESFSDYMDSAQKVSTYYAQNCF